MTYNRKTAAVSYFPAFHAFYSNAFLPCRFRRAFYFPFKCPLDRLLADPYCLAPPKLGVGEFHADTDESSIEEAFRKYGGASNKVMHLDSALVLRI